MKDIIEKIRTKLQVMRESSHKVTELPYENRSRWDKCLIASGRQECCLDIEEYLDELEESEPPAPANLSTDEIKEVLILFITLLREAQDPYSSIINAESYVDKYLASRPDSKVVTDAMIEKAAKEFQHDTTTSFNQGMYSGYIFGAIDMRNGKIK